MAAESTAAPARGAYMNWTLGRKTLTSLSDGYNPVDYDIIHSVTPEKGAELQRAANRPDKPVFTHTMFLVRGEDHGPILIDAGMGNIAGPTLGWLPDSLAMAGVDPEEIELVLITHLHPDHCFGLVDDAGRARFPNARIAVHSDEYAFWFEPEGEANAPDSLKPYFGMVRASVEPYRDRITWDAPIHSVADVDALTFPPRTLNSKPSRFGSLRGLLDFYDTCAERGISLYGGGQFELGPGRGQIQYLASLIHPDAPNDVAPGGYNSPDARADLPRSPLSPAPAKSGFRWLHG